MDERAFSTILILKETALVRTERKEEIYIVEFSLLLFYKDVGNRKEVGQYA